MHPSNTDEAGATGMTTPTNFEDPAAGMNAIAKTAEELLDAVRERIDAMFEEVLRERLEAWAARFPLHRFEAFQGHGLLCVKVSPPFGEDRRLEWQDLTDMHRHVVDDLSEDEADLVEEIEALTAAHTGLEWQISTSDTHIMVPERDRVAGTTDEPETPSFGL